MKKTLGWLVWGVLFAATALSAQSAQNAQAGWRMPGYARDIAIGGDGANDIVWMVEKAPAPRRAGGIVCKWNSASGAWERTTRTAESIAVHTDGTPWVVDVDGKIFQGSKFYPNTWTQQDGYQQTMRARDIAFGSNPDNRFAYIIGTDNKIYFFIGATWIHVADFKNGEIACRIDMDINENPWVVNSTGTIYRFDPNNQTWIDMSYAIDSRNRRSMIYAIDIAVENNGWYAWIAPKNLPQRGHLYYTMNWSNEDPKPKTYWYMGPVCDAVRLDTSDGEILTVNAIGEIWWVSLE